MSVQTFQPQVYVVLKKNVGRSAVTSGSPTSQRFQGAAREIDLTPYLGEDGAVVVDKSVRSPAGMFSVVLADKLGSALDSLYAAIEPMDVIEIRMARDTSKYAGMTKNMPIMMRGFVTNIRREEGVDQEGRPRRFVSIDGQDYGKILQIMQIAYLTNEVLGQLLLTYLAFFENYNPDFDSAKPAATFIKELHANVTMKFIADMRAAAGGGASPILDIQVDATVTQGMVAPFGTVQSFDGNVYQMMCRYGDVGPWNELFIEDREAGVFLVYRPIPFKDTSGSMIQPDAPSPAVVAITDKQVIGISHGRSDAGVYNYYWVNPLTFNLNTPGYAAIKAAHAGDVNEFYIGKYPNSSTSLYGFRRLQVDTQQGPRFDGQAESKYDDGTSVTDAFISNRRGILRDNNKDNVLFEDGNMRLQGNEAIRAGVTVSLTRGTESKPSEYYAVSVRHTFLPFRSYTTAVEFERGTGFIKRIQNDGASPYLSEMNARGLYDGQ